MTRLTNEFIETDIQQPESGQRFYRDEDIAGFAIRATRKSKAYILEKRVGGSTRRMTIGKCSEMSLDSVRKQACILLGEIEHGNDPRTGKRINTRCSIKWHVTFCCLRCLLECALVKREKLEVPPYALKKLVNHSLNDITGQYLVLDIERLRQHMSLITNGFLKLLNVEDGEVIDCHLPGEFDFAEFTQLRITFEEDPLPV